MLADVGKSVWSLTTAGQNSFPESFHSVYGEVGRGKGKPTGKERMSALHPVLELFLLL